MASNFLMIAGTFDDLTLTNAIFWDAQYLSGENQLAVRVEF